MSAVGRDFLLDEVTEVEGGWRSTVRVEESSPWFEGHFPGGAILPAVGQVELVVALHDQLSGRKLILGAIPNLRLMNPVRPGDRLTVDLRPDEDRVSFHLESAERQKVSTGAFTGSPNPRAEAKGHESPTRSPSRATHLDPKRLLPHAPPALLALEVIGYDSGGLDLEDGPPAAILCRGRVPADHASVERGQAGIWMAIELAAQAAGLLQAAVQASEEISTLSSPTPSIGYLVRVRHAHFTAGFLPAEADLLARIELQSKAGPLSHYRTTVGIPGGSTLTTASLSTYVPEE